MWKENEEKVEEENQKRSLKGEPKKKEKKKKGRRNLEDERQVKGRKIKQKCE